MPLFVCASCGFQKQVGIKLCARKVLCPKCKAVGRVPASERHFAEEKATNPSDTPPEKILLQPDLSPASSPDFTANHAKKRDLWRLKGRKNDFLPLGYVEYEPMDFEDLKENILAGNLKAYMWTLHPRHTGGVWKRFYDVAKVPNFPEGQGIYDPAAPVRFWIYTTVGALCLVLFASLQMSLAAKRNSKIAERRRVEAIQNEKRREVDQQAELEKSRTEEERRVEKNRQEILKRQRIENQRQAIRKKGIPLNTEIFTKEMVEIHVDRGGDLLTGGNSIRIEYKSFNDQFKTASENARDEKEWIKKETARILGQSVKGRRFTANLMFKAKRSGRYLDYDADKKQFIFDSEHISSSWVTPDKEKHYLEYITVPEKQFIFPCPPNIARQLWKDDGLTVYQILRITGFTSNPTFTSTLQGEIVAVWIVNNKTREVVFRSK